MPKYVANSDAGVLIGWKLISRYLGVCERTCKNWEKHGLPIARLPDGRVGMSKSLLDQWFIARIHVTTHKQEQMLYARRFHPSAVSQTEQQPESSVRT